MNDKPSCNLIQNAVIEHVNRCTFEKQLHELVAEYLPNLKRLHVRFVDNWPRTSDDYEDDEVYGLDDVEKHPFLDYMDDVGLTDDGNTFESREFVYRFINRRGSRY